MGAGLEMIPGDIAFKVKKKTKITSIELQAVTKRLKWYSPILLI